jgi:hypothetical protein
MTGEDMRINRFGRLLGVVALFSTGACAAGGPATAPSAAAPARWTEPAAYTYVLTTGCTRGFVDARYQVEVRNAVVVSATAENEQARSQPDHRAPTLGELSGWIATREPGNPRLRRDTDPADGRPVAFGFDADAMSVDAGECYAVSDYHPQ